MRRTNPAARTQFGLIAVLAMLFLASTGPLRLAHAVVPNVTVYAHGSFETAGIIMTLPAANNSGNESARLEVKGTGEPAYREAHPFTRYDANNMATSLFGLAPNTTYDLRITLQDPDAPGLEPILMTVTTRPAFVLPNLPCTATVSTTTALRNAAASAQAGQVICVQPGTYANFSMTDRMGTAAAPIIIRASDPNNRPIIDGSRSLPDWQGAIDIRKSAYVYLDGFEVRNAGTGSWVAGVMLRSSAHLVLQNSYIHDNSGLGIMVMRGYEYPGGVVNAGYHLIQDNRVDNQRHGIQLDERPGSNIVVRRNTVTGGKDNAKVCGDEESGRDLAENIPHVLRLTDPSGTWNNHNLDFYDNVLDGGNDDNIELDGICVNAKIFRNTFIGSNRTGTMTANSFSVAPAMPGPYFVLRNVLTGDWQQGVIKFNTGGNANIPERNIYWYHNTIERTGRNSDVRDTVMALWYDKPGDHDVPVKNILFKNNIFHAAQGGQLMDSSGKIAGSSHPDFDYDLWFSSSSMPNLFEWYDGVRDNNYATFTAFQTGTAQAGMPQEPNGLFGDPQLDSALVPQSGSPAIDRGVRIPGINDDYRGNNPDIGAFESGVVVPPAPNQSPVVDAGPDQTITALSFPVSTNVDGLVSDDGLPNPPGVLTAAWSQVSGPQPVSFVDAASPSTIVTFTAAGTYVLRLTAGDSELSANDDITITIELQVPPTNQPPVVNAGPDGTIDTVAFPVTTTLEGVVTDDGLPNPPAALTYAWTQVSGPQAITFASPAQPRTLATITLAGTYVLRLTASDGALSANATVTLLVNDAVPPNPTAPTVWISPASQTAPVGQQVTVDVVAEAVTNLAGYQLSLTYDAALLEVVSVAEGTFFTSAGASTFFRPPDQAPGQLTNLAAVITSGPASVSGQGTVATVTFVVRRAGTSPVTLTSVLLSDPAAQPLPNVQTRDGQIIGEGLPVPNPVCGDGVLDAGEQCDDGNTQNGDGCDATCQRELPPTNQPPVVEAGRDQIVSTNTLPVTVTLSCTITDDGLPIPPGQTNMAWIQVSGPVQVNIQNPHNVTINVSLPKTGVYVFACLARDGATDNKGQPITVRDEVQVTVVQQDPAPTTCEQDCQETCSRYRRASRRARCLERCLSRCEEPVPNPVCGDGVLDAGEQCDDGNTQNGDGCDATCQRELPPTNQPPVVNAGPDGTIDTVAFPVTTTLEGVVTDDGLPNPPAALTYAWTQVSGPQAITFASPAQPRTLATITLAGTYVLRLTASDSQFSDADETTIIVNAVPTPSMPPIIASLTPSGGAAGTTVTLTGTGFSTTGNSIRFESGRTVSNLASVDGQTLVFQVPSGVQDSSLCGANTNPGFSCDWLAAFNSSGQKSNTASFVTGNSAKLAQVANSTTWAVLALGDTFATSEFVPKTLTIKVGDLVTWQNMSRTLRHEVTGDAPSGPFASRLDYVLSTPDARTGYGETIRSMVYDFNAAGTYGYHCHPHGSPGAGMSGTITVTPTPAPKPAGLTIAVSPASQDASVGARVSVAITIADAATTAGYQFDLAFDGAILAFANAQVGNFLSANPSNIFFRAPTVGVNRISGLAAVLTNGATASGSGTLATLTFDVIGTGTSVLALQQVLISDAVAQSIPVAQVIDGQVIAGTVNQVTTAPSAGGDTTGASGASTASQVGASQPYLPAFVGYIPVTTTQGAYVQPATPNTPGPPQLHEDNTSRAAVTAAPAAAQSIESPRKIPFTTTHDHGARWLWPTFRTFRLRKATVDGVIDEDE